MYYEVATVQEQFPPGFSAYFSDFVEQCPANILNSVQTAGLSKPFVSISTAHIVETVPQSFLNALADFQAGRVVDMDTALNDPPPGV